MEGRGVILSSWEFWDFLGWWRRKEEPKRRCPHGHSDWDDCPVCCH